MIEYKTGLIKSMRIGRSINKLFSQTLTYDRPESLPQICLSIPHNSIFTSDKHLCDFIYVFKNQNKPRNTQQKNSKIVYKINTTQ